MWLNFRSFFTLAFKMGSNRVQPAFLRTPQKYAQSALWFWHLLSTAKWIWDRSIFSPNKPKLDMGLFVDFCVCIYLFLPIFAWCVHEIVLFCTAEQFYEHIIQKLVKTGKYTKINKQSNVKFWLNWSKYGTVSYSFKCNLSWHSKHSSPDIFVANFGQGNQTLVMQISNL
jgi:hypothetical protein